MRWLMIVFLVSLLALLLASAGVAYHVWRERVKRRQSQSPLETAESTYSTRNTNPASDPDTEEAP